ncbi:uncharacterized protein LOC117112210 [Anneissia japonica]|uniref:uncharacterized protein LOC117112210 n=1 Tax=Anneissia japonica TaxID=1529436 RepID=UPI0014259659|nr:uncharacterized protein LOC117112210 [Anneissia japonica]
MLTNPWSTLNKIDEISVFLKEKYVDIGIFSESWINKQNEHTVCVEGFTLFYEGRTNRNGGGVAALVKDGIVATKVNYLPVPEELECMWLQIQLKRTPREFSAIFICVVYHSPGQSVNSHFVLIQYLRESVDIIRSRSPRAGLIICGDFNEVRHKIGRLCSATGLKQIVKQPTRGTNTLDLIVTNLVNYFEEPLVFAPFGFSDHATICWKPNPSFIGMKGSIVTKSFRPFSESNVNAFGKWITNKEWHEVTNANDVNLKLNIFERELNHAYEHFFPLRTIRVHSTDQPWITPKIKTIIKERQLAYHKYGQSSNIYRKYRNIVKWEIKQAKIKYYKYEVAHLLSSNSRQWFKQIGKMCGTSKNKNDSLNLNIDESDPEKIREVINSKLSEICQHFESLQINRLSTYLPYKSPPPTLTFWEVYYRLKKLNCNKAAAPGDLPVRLIKTFAFELAVPLVNIFNKSLAIGKVPTRWKEATITPIPKEKGTIIMLL